MFLTRGQDRFFASVEYPKGMTRDDLRDQIQNRESSWIIFDNHGTGFNYRDDAGNPKSFADKKERLKAYHDFGRVHRNGSGGITANDTV